MKLAEISLCRGEWGRKEAQKLLSSLQLRFLDCYTTEAEGIEDKEQMLKIENEFCLEDIAFEMPVGYIGKASLHSCSNEV